MQQKLKFKAIFIGDRYEVVEVTTHTHKCTRVGTNAHFTHNCPFFIYPILSQSP